MKVTIVGAGNVGASAARQLLQFDLVLLDIVEGVPQGKALDFTHAAAVENHDARIIGTTQYDETKDSDIVVITAGSPRKPEETREDTLHKNATIVEEITKKIAVHSPNCILIIVTNPLDVMCHVALKASNFPRERVLGMAGLLDSARFKTNIAHGAGCRVADVDAMVIGSHSDTMVPLTEKATVKGRPLNDVLTKERIADVIARTRDGGKEIGTLLQETAYHAPGAAVARMILAIANDEGSVLPCSVFLEGEYGIDGVFLGVPVVLGKGGVQNIVELTLSAEEQRALEASAAAVKKLQKSL